MPLLLLVLVALSAGLVAGLAAWRYPRLSAGSSAPAFEAARKVGESAAAHSRFRRTLVSRLDASAATGLALTLALLLDDRGRPRARRARLPRANERPPEPHRPQRRRVGKRPRNGLLDARPRCRHATGRDHRSGARPRRRARRRRDDSHAERMDRPVPARAARRRGDPHERVKTLADRARPTFNPAAAGLGPSFPSGHSATAAAFYAGAALLLSRRRGHVARAAFTGLAVGVAVAVASSRVLLDVHWLSDVIAGLLLGWGWFAICGIAFGGRLLQFGAPAELATAVADDDARERSSARLAHDGSASKVGRAK